MDTRPVCQWCFTKKVDIFSFFFVKKTTTNKFYKQKKKLFFSNSKLEQGYILRYYRILGSVRVRQLRVRDDSCDITSAFVPFYTSTGCYGFYADDTKETSPYGPAANETMPGEPVDVLFCSLKMHFF